VALGCAPLKALVIAPVALGDACSSAWAQGGMAAALGVSDSAQAHAEDTIAAGAGLVDTAAAHLLTSVGADTVRYLEALGAPFDKHADGTFLLNREAAHSEARVARVGGDLAGKAILETVVATARKSAHITIWEGVRAQSIITADDGCAIGAIVHKDGEWMRVLSSAVVLATGGVGGLFAVTTNPADLRGEGMAMAALSGAVITDPEFVQFHPTAIKVGRDPAPLATEALRGEGAILITKSGHRFCFDDHPDGELAPRDIVARAVFRADRELGGAFLDATKAIGAHFPQHFPTVFAACMSAGIDPRTTPIPVVPAVHYHMGGIKSDLHGQTTVEGLFAVGECASTGVHGANRLASNSLLEAAAFGKRVAEALKAHGPYAPKPAAVRPFLPPKPLDVALKQFLRNEMSARCGVIRDGVSLRALLLEIEAAQDRFAHDLSLIASHLIVVGALGRIESRGAHYRRDFPHTQEDAKHTYLTTKDGFAHDLV
jgi:L-aspartate oxidase